MPSPPDPAELLPRERVDSITRAHAVHHLQSGTDPSLLCITAARISGLPQAVRVQIEDLGNLACLLSFGRADHAED